jgi:hypothetical protein
MLAQAGLNDAASRGLSSWNVLLLVLAAMQAEGLAPEGIKAHFAAAAAAEEQFQDSYGAGGRPQEGDQLLSVDAITQFRVAQHQHLEQQQQQRAVEEMGQQDPPGQSSAVQGLDLGRMLVSLLLRFGVIFSYRKDAVSVAEGGVVEAPENWAKHQLQSGQKIGVKDPMKTAKLWNAAGPTEKCREIKGMLAVGAYKLLVDSTLKQQLTGGLMLPEGPGNPHGNELGRGAVGAAKGAQDCEDAAKQGMELGALKEQQQQGQAGPFRLLNLLMNVDRAIKIMSLQTANADHGMHEARREARPPAGVKFKSFKKARRGRGS